MGDQGPAAAAGHGEPDPPPPRLRAGQDDDRAVQQATEHLLRLGHRRIAALAGRLGSFRSAQRLNGCRNALAQAGIEEDPLLVVGDLATPERARDAVIRLLHQLAPPTAVLAQNLGISTGVLAERLAGRHAFAFIGLDETDLTKGLGVSAVVRDPQEVGRQAARLALDRITDAATPPRLVTVPSRLVMRGGGEVGP
ncbi:substrate-binding domain-containing protein [Streptomyces sp. NPDC013157]|uniref:substrate-binding domain-containing protein n=1 Tax=Streptomyces sp. NPDC013157 TaxID=3364861 RepID=UPI0036AFE088